MPPCGLYEFRACRHARPCDFGLRVFDWFDTLKTGAYRDPACRLVRSKNLSAFYVISILNLDFRQHKIGTTEFENVASGHVVYWSMG